MLFSGMDTALTLWVTVGAIGVAILYLILNAIKGINMKVSELAAALTTLNTQVEKVRVEVQKLKDSLSDVDLPPEAEQALASLTTALKAVDDINVDEA